MTPRLRGPVTALAAAACLAGVVAAPSPAAPSGEADRSGGREGAWPRLVEVGADSTAERTAVAALGLDVTAAFDADGLQVVAHGPRDLRRLRATGLGVRVLVDDLGALDRRVAAADARWAARRDRSDLPSGRSTYRQLPEINEAMQRLARAHPARTRPLVIGRSGEGRPIRGIEISAGADDRADGKPVMVLVGAHHAREWPSAEHALEFAYELLRAEADPRVETILDEVRTIVVPVVNVDGFAVSRRANDAEYAYKRKDCDVSRSTPPPLRRGPCDDNKAGSTRGTDPNRNYPSFWGGPGSSRGWRSDIFRGDRPSSSPEVTAVRRLVSARDVVTMISLHTYGDLVLRPPGIRQTGSSPDERVLRTLGARFAAANDYANIPAYKLYGTTGTTDDWAYWTTGALAYTFEIGTDGFHPRFNRAVVAEYLGRRPAAGAGQGGNREAFLRAAMATRDADLHAVVRGQAPAGYRLELTKSFRQGTWAARDDGGQRRTRLFTDALRLRMRSQGGAFSWIVNPSTRPLVRAGLAHDPVAGPQADQDLDNPGGVPDPGAAEEVGFRVLRGHDDGALRVDLDWAEADGTGWRAVLVGPDGLPAAASAGVDPDELTVLDPVPGDWVLRVTRTGAAADWSASLDFLRTRPATYEDVPDHWMLSCYDAAGDLVATQEVVVGRGGDVAVGAACEEPAD